MFGQPTSVVAAEPTYQGSDLCAAVRAGNFPLCYMLVKQGAGVDRHDSQGYTPLQWAVLNDYHEIAAFLLQNGASVDLRSTDPEQSTALMWASLKGHLRMIQLLLSWGADANASDARGYTAIFHAVHYDQLFALHLLLHKRANVTHLDSEGHCVLHWAAYKGCFDICVYLLEQYKSQLPVDRVCNLGRTALMWAAREGHVPECCLLLSHGASMTATDKDGLSAQKHAAEKGHLHMPPLQQLATKNPEAVRHHAVSGTEWVNKDSVRIFFLPILAFIVIAYAHPILGALVFFAAMGMFGRYTNSWKHGTTRTPVHTAWWLGSVAVMVFVYFQKLATDASMFSPWLNVCWLVCFPVVMLSYAKGATMDMGRVPRSRDDMFAGLKVVESGAEIDPSRYCTTCKVRRPLRSKHCRFTGQCVARYDHYCVWFNCPVGFQNHPYFLLYCISHFFADVFLIWFCYDYIGRYSPKDATFSERWFAWDPVVTWMLGYNVVVGIFTLLMSATHIQYAMRNMTTNEAGDPERHFDHNGESKYNVGTGNNVKQFLGLRGHAVDWRRVFEWPLTPDNERVGTMAIARGGLVKNEFGTANGEQFVVGSTENPVHERKSVMVDVD
jgi:hypothetical protein